MRPPMKVLSANGDILEVCHPSGGCYVCKSGFFGYYDKSNKRSFFDFTFLKEHQGPPGYAHGGYIALFLDEVMSFATYDYFPALLGKMEIYYKKSVPLGNKVLFEAKLVKVERKKIIVEGSITYNRETLVKSSGIYVRI
ncbi:MAG: PaaI family thioesterase [Candidatus Calescibacterium sp.]|nr:PaaI family thioesterase [Candidatus Calescibacterium sp.]